MRAILPLVFVTIALSGCIEANWDLRGEHLPTALLKQDLYPDVVVEFKHAPGHRPCQSTLDAVEAVLRAVADKREITVLASERIPAGSGGYSNADLAAIHRAHLKDGDSRPNVHGQGEVAVLHILLLNGKAESTGAGHAAGRTLHDEAALFVFKDTFSGVYRLDRHLRKDATCEVERTVVLHELGHAFGLVNRGIPMLHDRMAPDHPGHSTNPGSVMYPLLRLRPDGLLLQEPPRNFDVHDYADLRAFVQGS